MKKVLVFCLLLVMALAAVGCSDNADQSNPTGEVIGSVNGVNLYRAEFDSFFSNMVGYYLTNYYDYLMMAEGVDLKDEESSRDFLGRLEQSVWQTMIHSQIVLETAEKDYGITQEESYLESVMSYSEYRSYQVQIIYSKMAEALREEMLAAAEVTEDDARAAYDADPAQWDGRSTSHILITCDVSDEAAKAEALAEAQEVLDKLNAGGDFAELAAEYSDDGSASTGGVFDAYINSYAYQVGSTSAVFPEYAAGAFSLENVGDYTQEPVLSSAGYHIIKLDDLREGFDAVKDLVTASLITVSDEEVVAALDALLAERIEAADVVEMTDFRYYEPAADEEAAE